jgi:hypothetical protein
MKSCVYNLQSQTAGPYWNDKCCSHQSSSTACIHQGYLCSEQSNLACSDHIFHLPHCPYRCNFFHSWSSSQCLEYHMDMVYIWGNLGNLGHTHHIVGPQIPHDIRKFLLPRMYKLTHWHINFYVTLVLFFIFSTIFILFNTTKYYLYNPTNEKI